MADEITDTNDDAYVSANPWDPDTDPDNYTADDIRAKDWFFDTVLNFAHGINDEALGGVIGLTVTSGGVVLSGLAVSRAEWMAGVVDQYKEAGAGETTIYIEKLFNQAHDEVLKHAKRRGEAELPTRARSFLHMKDVRIGVGNVYTQVPLWRGALADITGWSLGSWNPKQNPAVESD